MVYNCLIRHLHCPVLWCASCVFMVFSLVARCSFQVFCLMRTLTRPWGIGPGSTVPTYLFVQSNTGRGVGTVARGFDDSIKLSCIVFTFPTMIFRIGVSGFVTDCLYSACPLYVGSFEANLFWISWFVSTIEWAIFLVPCRYMYVIGFMYITTCIYIHIYIDGRYWYMLSPGNFSCCFFASQVFLTLT